MKEFKICIQALLENRSVEFTHYYTLANNLDDAKKYVKECVNNWNLENKKIMYNIFYIREV